MRKYPNGTKLFAIDCDINEVPNLVRPCHNQPCEFSQTEYLIVSPGYGRRRRARASGNSYLPAIKAGNGNHWQMKKRQQVHALIGDRVSAIEGTRIYLKCLYGGKPEPKATWYIGNRRIDNDRHLPYRYSYKDYVTTLEIPSMKKYLAGSYACRVENRYGIVRAKSEVRISRPGETTILSQRKRVEFSPEDKIANITIGTNATLYEGTKVKLICPVQVYPFRLRVRWSLRGVRLTAGIRRVGYYATDLQIRRATHLHSGTYICTGESQLGSDSGSSTITILRKIAPKIHGSDKRVFGQADAYPYVNITIGDTLVAEDGAMIKVSCPATGSPPPRIIWLRRGVPIQLPMINMFSQDDGNTLVIKSMRKDASDTYSCVASNIVGQVSDDTKIKVLPPGAFPPKIKRKTGSVLVIPTNHNQTVNIGQIAMVFEGRSLTIHCPVKGIPKPAVSWKFEGKDIRQISGVNVMVDKSGGGLMIVEVNKLIAGKVSCVAENVLGSSSASSLIKIQASSQPKVIVTGSDVRTGKKRVGTSVAIGNNLKTSGARKIKIVCPVSGWPIPKVIWHKNGKPVEHPANTIQFGTAKGSVMVIDDARVEDSGLYTCYAINPAGVAMSSSTLQILSPGSPVITSGRSTKKILKQSNDITIDIGTNITTLLGSTLTLKCPFEGDANALVEWTVDSQPIKFNKRIYTVSKNVLRIKDITFFDNGAYVCRVFNSNGNDSESTLLKISAPHNSILQASNRISKLESFNADEDLHVVIGHNVTVTKGHNIFITCPVRGVVRPTILWKKGSEEIKSDPRISVEGEQLLLTNVNKDDSGTYYCFVKTAHGTSNSRTHLDVIVPTKPVIYKSSMTLHGEDVSKTRKITIGDRLLAVKDLTIEIACRVAGGVPSPRISWYHNSAKIVSNGAYATIKENSDLLIPKLDESLQGAYKCVAENMKGQDEATSSIMIMLSIPPIIKKSSKHITDSPTDSGPSGSSVISIKVGDTLKTNSGRDIMIDCEADGIPKPRVIWTKDNEDLSSSGRISIFENGSLLLQETSEEDTGIFACTVINNRGVDMYSSKIKIMGQNTAMVLAEEKEEKLDVTATKTKVKLHVGTNVTTLGGKSVVLLCPVKGEPKPRIFWYKDAIELEASDEVTFGAKGELILGNVSIEDAGRYTCVAENEYGRYKMSTTVNVAVTPDNLIEAPAEYEKSDLRSKSVSKKVKMNIGMSGDVLSRKTVTIECPTKGSIRPKITWLMDGKEIRPNGKYKIEGRFLTVHNHPSGKYEFTCRAEMFLGTDEMNTSINFIDPVAPIVTVIKRHKVITDQKVRVTIGGSVKVKFGSQLDIRCPHFGVPTPEVSWFRNGKSLTEDDDFIIKGSGEVLRIPFVRMNDNATYICEVSNGVGRKAMGEIIVAVFKPERPAIKVDTVIEKGAELPDETRTVYPTMITMEDKSGVIGRNYSIVAGMTLTLKCPVAGDPKPDIVWLKSGEVIALNKETLVINRTNSVDNGVYVCKASNVFGVKMVSSHVNVMEQKRPIIQRNSTQGSQPKIVSEVSGKGSVRVDIGDDLKTLIGTEILIRCPVTGVPAPKLSFYKGDNLLTANDNFAFNYGRGVMTIKKAEVGYEGEYSCVAENPVGESRMKTKIELLKPVPPKIQESMTKPVYNYDVMKGKGYVKGTVGSGKISGYPGTELLIDCPVIGFPMPDIIWSKDGKRLNPEYDFVEIGRNGSLTVPHLTNEMEGIYECFAVNAGGGYAKNITVSVVDPVSPRILKGSGTKDMIQTLNVNVTIGQDVTVLYGAQIYIKCPFKAVPQGTVIWSGTDDVALEARRAIEVDDGKALLISKATKESGAMYQCIVSNIFGSDVAKTTVTVTESLKPIITSVKERAIADFGANEVNIVIGGRLEAPAGILVSLSCPFSGTPRPNINWLFNGKLIYEAKTTSDSEAAAYTISKIRLKDSGVYTCVAENILGSDNASTHIQVGLRPTIQSLAKKGEEISAVMQYSVTVPVSSKAIVKTDSSVLIQCFSHGIPTPTVKWYKNGNVVDYEKRYASYINGLLDIKAVSPLDDGLYTCVAKNKFGSVKATAQLVVVDPPRIASRKENRTEIKSENNFIQTTVGGSITVLRGVQLVISCPAKGTPEPDIVWKRNNAYHAIDPRVGLTVDKSLQIKEITPQDAGTYTCIAKNKAGVDESTINVYVAEPPSDQRANAPSVTKKIVVSKGDSVTIVCSLQGKPMPVIRWFKEGKKITIDGMKYQAQGDELYIQSATEADGGIYGCVGENMAGRNTASSNLIVGESPKIVKGTGKIFRSLPTTMKAVIGQSIGIRQNSVLMIVCEYSGTPSPLISWTRNGNEVDSSLLAEGSKILLLRNVSFTDAGNYTCRVKSELGDDKATSELVVIDPPKIKEPKRRKPGGFVFLNEDKVKTVNVIDGEVVKFVCIAIGFPMPKVRWLKNMHELKHKTKFVSWTEKRTIIFKKTKIIGKVFTILTLKVQSQDVSVGCKAFSFAGKASAHANLIIHQPPTPPYKGIWVSTESGQCDGSCVKAFIATQQLKVECQTYGRKILSVDHCDPRTRPNGRKECQTSRCATKLVIGPWGKCSSSCGYNGFRNRSVNCIYKTTSNTTNDKFCSHISPRKPNTHEPCNRFKCPLGNCEDIAQHCSSVFRLGYCGTEWSKQHCCKTCKQVAQS